MKMRKILAIILTIVMAASMLCTGALAAGDPTFRGAEIEAKAGDTVTYDVYIENNPGIAGYMVRVDFSEEVFDIETQKEDEHENTLKIALGDFVDASGSIGGIIDNKTAYGCVVLWYNTEEVSDDGSVFSITFKVSKDAVNGEHAVKIRYDAINTLDVEGNLIAFETIDGSITVSGGVDGTINNDEVGPSAEELKQIEAGTLTENGNVIKEGESAVQIEKGEQLDVEGENAEDVDSPNQDADADDGEGMNIGKLILIIAASVVAVVVIVLVAVKAKAKKAAATIGIIPGNNDREMEIEEVMGWNDADADADEDDED